MSEQRDLLTLATNYHKALPHRLRSYLHGRGIPDVSIDYHLIGWNGERITIPIFNREGNLAFFKLARDPDDPILGPKMMTSPGAYAELYGWEEVLGKSSPIIICEGEFDRLVLETKHFHAVTSTAGASVFRVEWAPALQEIPEVYICYDRDEAGYRGAIRVGQMIPHARIVKLPDEVGNGGDVSDFFVRLAASHADFEQLLAEAKPAPPPTATASARSVLPTIDESPLRRRIAQIKNTVPIIVVAGKYVKLEPSGDCLRGLCPFHEDHNPSLTIYPNTNTYHCFGCHMHGDVISFLRAVETLSFTQALDALEKFTRNHHGNESQQTQ